MNATHPRGLRRPGRCPGPGDRFGRRGSGDGRGLPRGAPMATRCRKAKPLTRSATPSLAPPGRAMPAPRGRPPTFTGSLYPKPTSSRWQAVRVRLQPVRTFLTQVKGAWPRHGTARGPSGRARPHLGRLLFYQQTARGGRRSVRPNYLAQLPKYRAQSSKTSVPVPDESELPPVQHSAQHTKPTGPGCLRRADPGDLTNRE